MNFRPVLTGILLSFILGALAAEEPRERVLFVCERAGDPAAFAATAAMMSEFYDVHVAYAEDESSEVRRVCEVIGAVPHFKQSPEGLLEELKPCALFGRHSRNVRKGIPHAFREPVPEIYYYESETAQFPALYHVDVTCCIDRKIAAFGAGLAREEKRGAEMVPPAKYAEAFATADGVRIRGGVLEQIGAAVRGDLAPYGCARIASVGGAVVKPSTNPALPEELRISPDEAQEITRRFAAERRATGFRPYGEYVLGCGHSIRRWAAGNVWKTHREFFGLTPYGTRGIEMGSGFPSWMHHMSKLCVANEDVVDFRVREWKNLKLCRYLPITENDGLAGYCRCEKCRALDADLPGEPFLAHKTDRYVNLWNRMIGKMRPLRPDVKCKVFLYSVMRHPPRRERVAFPDNLLGIYVPSYHDSFERTEADLRAWKGVGLKYFYLRPNYLHNRTVLPIGREKFICDMHHLFRRYGSLGDSFGSDTTSSATKFEIYAALRLCARPEITFEEIADEWYARFGAAAACVKRYYERVRARCDREWPQLVKRLEEQGVEYLDDSHFSRNVHELHTVWELEGDLAVLERFDAAALVGEARRNFEDLVLVARHYVLTLKTLQSQREEDKAALVSFRARHKTLLSQNWWVQWNKGEFWLWNPTKEKFDYENSAITSWIDKWERTRSAEVKFKGPAK